MTQHGSKTIAVSDQLSYISHPIARQPMAGTDDPAPKDDRLAASETPEPDGIPIVTVSSPQSDAHMGRSLGQILIVLVVFLVLVNIPMNYHGAGLAQVIPEATPMVMYDGIVLKGSGPETYVLQDHKLRWISNPEAFDYYFHQYDIHTVEDKLLNDFTKGPPIYRLLTCPDSPHTYAVENGYKRWVKDPPKGNKATPWDEVRLVSCNYLHNLPDGLPILEDTGPSP
jgi:hypothetical protein